MGEEALETEHWEFDVKTVLHDDLKDYGLEHAPSVKSRVVLSRVYSFSEAKDLAGCMAVSTNGGMPVEILWGY